MTKFEAYVSFSRDQVVGQLDVLRIAMIQSARPLLEKEIAAWNAAAR